MTAEDQRKLHNIATIGTVFEIKDDTMRLDVGDNQTDYLPIPALYAGQVSVWRCPSIGEQFLLVSPSGDLANAIPVMPIYSDQFPAPSHDPNEIRIRYNDTDFLSIKTTDSQLTLKMSEINFDGDLNVTGNVDVGKNVLVGGDIHSIGDTVAGNISLKNHKHGRVQSGKSNTGEPQ